MKIRRADEDDLPTIHSIEKICFSPIMAFPEQMLAVYLRHATTLVAEAIGDQNEIEIIGFAMGFVKGEWGKTITLDVHPHHRRKGAGNELMEALEKEFASKGAKSSQLEVYEGNQAALTLYYKRGYQKANILKNYYGNDKNAILMWKNI